MVGDIGNAVAGGYGSINSITGGLLDRTLKVVPGAAPAMKLGGTALNFYNRQIDPRRVAVTRAIDTLGSRLQEIH